MGKEQKDLCCVFRTYGHVEDDSQYYELLHLPNPSCLKNLVFYLLVNCMSMSLLVSFY
jgi:hypothetical protein